MDEELRTGTKPHALTLDAIPVHYRAFTLVRHKTRFMVDALGGRGAGSVTGSPNRGRSGCS